MTIANQQWDKAQKAERKAHKFKEAEGRAHFNKVYAQYFAHLKMRREQDMKIIMEIGCGDFPALSYATNYEFSYIVEPMPSPILQKIATTIPVRILQQPAEDIPVWPQVDEVWLFNVLQHVKDPDLIVKKSKEVAGAIRFFEPINAGKDAMHLHEFSLDAMGWLFSPECVKHYAPKETVHGFHNSECAYGTWRRDK